MKERQRGARPAISLLSERKTDSRDYTVGRSEASTKPVRRKTGLPVRRGRADRDRVAGAGEQRVRPAGRVSRRGAWCRAAQFAGSCAPGLSRRVLAGWGASLPEVGWQGGPGPQPDAELRADGGQAPSRAEIAESRPRFDAAAQVW